MRIRVSRGMWLLLGGSVILGTVSMARTGVSAGELWARGWPWLVVLLAAGLHEWGHILVAWMMDVPIGGLKLDLFGARMELMGLLSYKQEFWVAAGGPGVNLISAALVYPCLARQDGEGVTLFFGASLVLGVVNLLPVGTLDGGRMLRSVTAWLWGDRTATVILGITTGICLGGLWLLAVYGLLRVGQMLSVFAFSLCLLLRCFSGKSSLNP